MPRGRGLFIAPATSSHPYFPPKPTSDGELCSSTPKPTWDRELQATIASNILGEILLRALLREVEFRVFDDLSGDGSVAIGGRLEAPSRAGGFQNASHFGAGAIVVHVGDEYAASNALTRLNLLHEGVDEALGQYVGIGHRKGAADEGEP
jgi:hypothetical protein